MFKELSKEEKSRQRWKGREAYADIPINYSKNVPDSDGSGFLR
jgi:hypothetical protein